MVSAIPSRRTREDAVADQSAYVALRHEVFLPGIARTDMLRRKVPECQLKISTVEKNISTI